MTVKPIFNRLIGVVIAGSGPLYSGSNTIGGTAAGTRNLISGNLGDGIQLLSDGGNVVAGNYIGTDATGTAAVGNGGDGIEVLGSSNNNTIGGAASGAGNLISGNHGDGVFFGLEGLTYFPTGNTLQGNLIGTDATGTRALANVGNGIDINRGTSNTIGGTILGARNLISGNQLAGVYLYYGVQNVVAGNYIGTDATGTAALGNGGDGIDVIGSSANTIGGAAPGAGNLISGNHGDGVLLSVASTGASANSNILQGNLIGTDASATIALGNAANGVTIRDSSNNTISLNNTIGGTGAGAGNTIAFNGNDGVLVDTGTGNAILSNSIFANGNLGIELTNNGNNNQAAPRLLSAVQTGSGTTIVERLRSTPNTTFTLQFFSDPSPDPSGLGEGRQLLGTFTVTTNPAGIATFVLTVPTMVPAGQIITATATDPNNNTSEFSVPVEVKQGLRSYDTSYSNGNVFHRIYFADGSSMATLTNSSGVLLDDYSYNAQGQLTTYDTYYANGNIFHRIYAADGSSTATLTDPSDVLLDDYSYNAQGQLTAYDVYYSNGNVFHRTYASDGSSTATLKDKEGNTLQTDTFDTQGRLTQIIYANGSVLGRTYASDGSSTATLKDQNGHLLDDYSYNAQGVLTAYDVYYANGNVFNRQYASDGSSTGTLKSSGGGLIQSYNYNAQGQLTRIVYASNGNVLTYTYTGGVLASAALNASASNGGALLQAYNYNTQGQLTSVVYANGNKLTYTYNTSGVLTTATLINSSGATLQTSNYTYNAQGQLSSIKDGSGTLLYSYTYDSLGRVSTITDGPGAGAGNNGDVLTYTYNSNGTSSATLTTSSGTLIETYHYDVFGRVTEIDYANGNTYTRTYNSDGTSTAILKDRNGNTIETYTYDAQGNLISHNP